MKSYLPQLHALAASLTGWRRDAATECIDCINAGQPIPASLSSPMLRIVREQQSVNRYGKPVHQE